MLPLRFWPSRFFELNLNFLILPTLMGLFCGGLILYFSSTNQGLHQEVNLLAQQNQKQLFEAHLQQLQQLSLKSNQASLEAELAQATSNATQVKHSTIDAIYDQYQQVSSKVSRNGAAKLDTSDIQSQYADWGQKLLNQQFDQTISTTDSTKKCEIESLTLYAKS